MRAWHTPDRCCKACTAAKQPAGVGCPIRIQMQHFLEGEQHHIQRNESKRIKRFSLYSFIVHRRSDRVQLWTASKVYRRCIKGGVCQAFDEVWGLLKTSLKLGTEPQALKSIAFYRKAQTGQTLHATEDRGTPALRSGQPLALSTSYKSHQRVREHAHTFDSTVLFCSLPPSDCTHRPSSFFEFAKNAKEWLDR